MKYDKNTDGQNIFNITELSPIDIDKIEFILNYLPIGAMVNFDKYEKLGSEYFKVTFLGVTNLYKINLLKSLDLIE